jgi:DNA-binding NarL/FixJ family response regulator
VNTSPVTVLVVDDHAAFRAAAAAVLRRTPGFVLVGEAEDGAAALDQVLALEPQLVLMDVRMPSVDGIEATRRILAQRPRTRVILCSTYDLSERDVPASAGARVAFAAKEEFAPDTLAALWARVSLGARPDAVTPPAGPPTV